MKFPSCCSCGGKKDQPEESVNEFQEITPPITQQPVLPTAINVQIFEQQNLDEHNRLRAIHNLPPLKLNRELCRLATEWATYLSKTGKFEHRPNNDYGENIYMSYGMVVDGKTSVKSWYDEIKDYNFNKHGFSGKTGHFTQVVWMETTEMGVGVGQKGSSTYVVANYNPPGNVMGKFPENVPSPLN